jgi:hypothetical protein
MKTNIRFSNILLAIFLFLVLFSIVTHSNVIFKIAIILIGLVIATIICFLSLGLVYLITRYIQRKMLIRQIKQEWFPKGKYVFFLYSSSKKWENYFKNELIPKIQDKSIIWNWSTRYQDGWDSDRFASRILSLYRPETHSYPIAVVFLSSGAVKVFKFYIPYVKMIKSGKPDYKKLEEEFLVFVNSL